MGGDVLPVRSRPMRSGRAKTMISKEAKAVYDREYRSKNGDRLREYDKGRRAKNRKRHSEYKKQYLDDHPDKKEEYRARYYEKHKDEILRLGKEYYAAYPEKDADRHLKRNYGIGLDEYSEMLVSQDGKCAICEVNQKELKTRFSVDHDHKTGHVRGLLCHRCNMGLGMFLDNPDIVSRAAKYLEEK